MIKNNKWKLFISSIIILLPIVFGVAFWNRFLEQMIIYWGFAGNAYGLSNRFFVVGYWWISIDSLYVFT